MAQRPDCVLVFAVDGVLFVAMGAMGGDVEGASV